MSTMIKNSTGTWVTVAGGQRTWVGTKAALASAVAAGSIPDGTNVMVTDDYNESATTIIKSYMHRDYNISSGEPTSIPAFSPTGWFNTGLKVDTAKVAVVLRHQHCMNSNGENVYPVVPYNVSNDAAGNLILQFCNISDVAKECVKCRVWFNLIGKPDDLPND